LWILESAARDSGDSAFALRFAEAHHREATGLVFYITEYAPNLREVFRARVRFAQMVSTGYGVEFREEGDEASFVWHFPAGLGPHEQFMDYAVTLVVQRIRHLLGQDWWPLEVRLQHPAPREREHFQRLFGSNVVFGAQHTSLRIAAHRLDKPLPNAISNLLRELERGAAALIANPHDQDLLQRASVLIARRRPNGAPSVDEAALALAMSRRTFQRRLGESGTNFRQLVDDVQANMARHMLVETDIPLVEIAMLPGFSESSSFSRAARDWLGEPPIEFRQKHRAA